MRYFAVSIDAGCSTVERRILSFFAPSSIRSLKMLKTVLFDSEAPELKYISPGSEFISAATSFLAQSMPEAEERPRVCMLEALP